MTHTERSGPAQGRPTTSTTLIVTRPGDGWRSRRLRKFARRHLDNLLGSCDPWDLAEPIDWHAIHMDRGVPERQAIGRDLLAAGWTP